MLLCFDFSCKPKISEQEVRIIPSTSTSGSTQPEMNDVPSTSGPNLKTETKVISSVTRLKEAVSR
jgi:hypothetical protein